LDHATARIVAELAAALLPSLTSDVKEAVAAEVARGARQAAALPERRGEDAGEELVSLHRASLQRFSETAASFAAAEASVERSVSELSSLMERFCERMEGVAARLAQAADDLARQSSGQFTALSSTLASVKSGLDDETLEDVAGTLRFLKEAIPGWEGVLKADGRMQTRELSEFSAEMSELSKDMKLSLAAIVRESAEKGAARDEERRKAAEENGQAMERRLARLEKIAVLTGAASAFFWLMTLLVVLFI
jgi:ABC-type transporter Mla subunit MlaD